jgi:hypothetical protein
MSKAKPKTSKPTTDNRFTWNPPTILALDVSSSVTGWAMFVGGQLDAIGMFRPRSASPALDRIDEITGKVLALVCDLEPQLVVMEISSGKVHGRIMGQASGLSVLGHAQGAVRALIVDRNVHVVAVSENEWTRGKVKSARAIAIARQWPLYGNFAEIKPDAKGKPSSKYDPGFDISDAIGVGMYFVGKAREAELIARATKSLTTKIKGGAA